MAPWHGDRRERARKDGPGSGPAPRRGRGLAVTEQRGRRAGACPALLSKQQAAPCGAGRKQVTADRGCWVPEQSGTGPSGLLGVRKEVGLAEGAAAPRGPPGRAGLRPACAGARVTVQGLQSRRLPPGAARAQGVTSAAEVPAGSSDLLVATTWLFWAQAVGSRHRMEGNVDPSPSFPSPTDNRLERLFTDVWGRGRPRRVCPHLPAPASFRESRGSPARASPFTLPGVPFPLVIRGSFSFFPFGGFL